MRLKHRVSLSLAVLAAVSLAGCGKKQPDPAKQEKAQASKEEAGGMSAARLRLKSQIQSQPGSGQARYELGALLLAEGDAPGAISELRRALELKHPSDVVLPVLADAMIQSSLTKPMIDELAGVTLTDPKAQARLLASVAYAMAVESDLAGAQAAVNKALAIDPKSAAVLLVKARLASVNNKIPDGLATLDGLLADEPNNDEAWALKGDLLQRQPNGRKAAAEAYGRALKIKPDQVYSQAALISLLLAQGEMATARAQFAILAKQAPKHLATANIEAHLAYAEGNHARAREVFQGLLQVMPESVDLLVASGENELKLNAAQQAEAQFAKAVALSPRNQMARRLLGQAQLRLGHAPKALNTLSPLAEPADASPEVLALAAEAHLLNGEGKAAESLYSRIAKLKPTDPRMRTVVASATLGRTDDPAAFNELRAIAAEDSGTSADLALIAAHLRREQADGALKALEGLERKRPNDPMVHNMRGQILAKTKDVAGARQNFEKALKVDPGYFPAAAALANLDIQENKPDAARQRLDDFLKSQPKNPQILLALAELLKRQRTPRADVLKPIEAAVKASPSDVDARIALISHHFAGNDFDAALNAAQAATAALPKSLELLELLGRCQLRVKQTSQALATYGKIVTLQPNSARGHIGQADVYLASNDLAQAQRSINRSLELSPGLPEAQAQAILLALRKNQPAAAISVARQVQADRPKEATGFLMEGDIEMRRGHWDAAAATLRKAVDKPSAGAAAMKLYQALARGSKPADAEVFASQWLKSHPNDVNLLFLMGDSAQVKGDMVGAEKRYEQVLAIDPEHVFSLNNLAMLRVKQNKPGAVELAERAVAGAPAEPAILDTLALTLASENKLAKAIEVQKRAVAIAPETPELRLTLAKWLIQAGEKAQAKSELDRLDKLGSQFAQHEEVTRLTESLRAFTLPR